MKFHELILEQKFKDQLSHIITNLDQDCIYLIDISGSPDWFNNFLPDYRAESAYDLQDLLENFPEEFEKFRNLEVIKTTLEEFEDGFDLSFNTSDGNEFLLRYN